MDSTTLQAEAERILRSATSFGMSVSVLDTYDTAERFILRWIRFNQHRPEYCAAAQMALSNLRAQRKAYIESACLSLWQAPVRQSERGMG
jgi:hypothetical protein